MRVVTPAKKKKKKVTRKMADPVKRGASVSVLIHQTRQICNKPVPFGNLRRYASNVHLKGGRGKRSWEEKKGREPKPTFFSLSGGQLPKVTSFPKLGLPWGLTHITRGVISPSGLLPDPALLVHARAFTDRTMNTGPTRRQAHPFGVWAMAHGGSRDRRAWLLGHSC